MGRAIDMENKLHALEQRVQLVEDALEEMIQTKVHHVDLTDTSNVVAEGTRLEPDEVYTAPIGKRKKTISKKTATVD